MASLLKKIVFRTLFLDVDPLCRFLMDLEALRQALPCPDLQRHQGKQLESKHKVATTQQKAFRYPDIRGPGEYPDIRGGGGRWIFRPY